MAPGGLADNQCLSERTSERTPEQRNDSIKTKAAVVSAFGTVIAIIALIGAAIQFYILRDHWRKELTINLILKAEQDLSYTHRHCAFAANSLDEDGVETVYNRQKMNLTANQVEAINKCFADLTDKELDDVYEYDGPKSNGNVKLKSKGSALLAARLNHYLNYDDFITSFLKYDLADNDMLLRYFKSRLCRPYYLGLREKLDKVMRKQQSNVTPDPVIEISKQIDCSGNPTRDKSIQVPDAESSPIIL
jgi:hypothetical protein